MNISVKPGMYIVAVSGGVDSMVLFDILRKMPEVTLVVAHYDHAMRHNSQQDRKFVQAIATSHNIMFEHESAAPGALTNEAEARATRYAFLRRIRKKYNADAIITAHHYDDVLETAIINMLRGTGRKGLSSLRSGSSLLRPLLGTSKTDILAYARTHEIEWREDATNLSDKYLRNIVRHKILPRFEESQKKILEDTIVRQTALNDQIDTALRRWLKEFTQTDAHQLEILRYRLIMLPPDVAYEILQHALKQHTGKTLERALAYNALHFIKTARPHRVFQLNNRWQLRVGIRKAIVEPRLS